MPRPTGATWCWTAIACTSGARCGSTWAVSPRAMRWTVALAAAAGHGRRRCAGQCGWRSCRGRRHRGPGADARARTRRAPCRCRWPSCATAPAGSAHGVDETLPVHLDRQRGAPPATPRAVTVFAPRAALCRRPDQARAVRSRGSGAAAAALRRQRRRAGAGRPAAALGTGRMKGRLTIAPRPTPRLSRRHERLVWGHPRPDLGQRRALAAVPLWPAAAG